MSDYKWSPSHNNFFPESMLSEYKQAGWDLSDLISIGDDIFNKFSSTPPEGKVRACGDDGMPSWIDSPLPSHDELTKEAETKKQALTAEASQKTQLWRTHLMLGIITEEDKISLKEWMLYVQDVQAVDTSSALDITWPVKPT